MFKNTINSKIVDFVKEHKVMSSRALFALLETSEPSLKYSTFKWRIHSLKEKGLIRSVGRGLYGPGGKLPAFMPSINRKMRLLNNQIKEKFPYLEYSLWTTQWLNEFMHHQPMSYVTLVDVEPEASSAVFNMLKGLWSNTKVFYRPTAEEFDRYVLGFQNVVIVKNLFSEAPVKTIDDVPTSMIEKIIVDIFAEKDIFAAYGGRELSVIFTEFDSRFSISKTKLLRYARRRKCENELLNQLKLLPEGVLNDHR